jgi:hypothetical protein
MLLKFDPAPGSNHTKIYLPKSGLLLFDYPLANPFLF